MCKDIRDSIYFLDHFHLVLTNLHHLILQPIRFCKLVLSLLHFYNWDFTMVISYVFLLRVSLYPNLSCWPCFLPFTSYWPFIALLCLFVSFVLFDCLPIGCRGIWISITLLSIQEWQLPLAGWTTHWLPLWMKYFYCDKLFVRMVDSSQEKYSSNLPIHTWSMRVWEYLQEGLSNDFLLFHQYSIMAYEIVCEVEIWCYPDQGIPSSSLRPLYE